MFSFDYLKVFHIFNKQEDNNMARKNRIKQFYLRRLGRIPLTYCLELFLAILV
jgi:hypothetical protein